MITSVVLLCLWCTAACTYIPRKSPHTVINTTRLDAHPKRFTLVSGYSVTATDVKQVSDECSCEEPLASEECDVSHSHEEHKHQDCSCEHHNQLQTSCTCPKEIQTSCTCPKELQTECPEVECYYPDDDSCSPCPEEEIQCCDPCPQEPLDCCPCPPSPCDQDGQNCNNQPWDPLRPYDPSIMLPNGCPMDYTIVARYPHEYDRNKYYECINGNLYSRTCPPGVMFNPLTGQCDVTIDFIPYVPAYCNWLITDIRRDMVSCGLYHYCVDGSRYAQTCWYGAAFSHSVQSCDWKFNVDCSTTTDDHKPSGPVPDGEECNSPQGEPQPSTADIRLFFFCVSGFRVTRQCPDNLAFSPDKKMCQHSIEMSMLEPLRPPRAFCPLGWYVALHMPHHTSCFRFFYCVDGSLIEKDCPPGTMYDPAIQNCNSMQRVTCVFGVPHYVLPDETFWPPPPATPPHPPHHRVLRQHLPLPLPHPHTTPPTLRYVAQPPHIRSRQMINLRNVNRQLTLVKRPMKRRSYQMVNRGHYRARHICAAHAKHSHVRYTCRKHRHRRKRRLRRKNT